MDWRVVGGAGLISALVVSTSFNIFLFIEQRRLSRENTEISRENQRLRQENSLLREEIRQLRVSNRARHDAISAPAAPA